MCAVSVISFINCYIVLMAILVFGRKGLTVYRALKYSGTHAGDWVVVPGAGGGLGHLGVLSNSGTSQRYSFLVPVRSNSVRSSDGISCHRHWYVSQERSKCSSCEAENSADTGLERKRLCLSLGATHWIDFATPSPEPNRSTDTNSTLADIVSEVLKLTDGRGAHAAIVTAHDVCIYLEY